jgi:hypothetical protein
MWHGFFPTILVTDELIFQQGVATEISTLLDKTRVWDARTGRRLREDPLLAAAAAGDLVYGSIGYGLMGRAAVEESRTGRVLWRSLDRSADGMTVTEKYIYLIAGNAIEAYEHVDGPLPSAVAWASQYVDGRGGHRPAQVLVNGHEVLRWRHPGRFPRDDYAYQEHMATLANRVQVAFNAGARPQDFSLRGGNGQSSIWYRDTLIVAVEEEQATLNHTTPSVLAHIWLANLRRAICLPPTR